MELLKASCLAMSEVGKQAQDQYSQQVSDTDKTWQLQTDSLDGEKQNGNRAPTVKGHFETYFRSFNSLWQSKNIFYNKIWVFVPFECSNCEVCIVWGDRKHKRHFSVCTIQLWWHEGSNHVYWLLKASYMVSCVTQFKVITLHRAFIALQS